MNQVFKKPVIIAVSLILLLSIVVLSVVRSKSFQFYGGIVYQINTREKVVALTFDDGPRYQSTMETLSILEKEKIKASFFLEGAEIKRHKKAGLAIFNAGHEIGNHSYTHSRMVFKSKSFIEQEITDTDKEIRGLGYAEDILFRPPYGQTLIALPRYLNSVGRPTIMFDVEVEDFKFPRTVEEMVGHTLESVVPGSIIVFHVMGREKERQALILIIKELKGRGYQFKTVSEMILLDNKS